MPGTGPGLRHPAVATKVVKHGDPVIETNIPGLAARSTNKQQLPYIDPLLDLPTSAYQIQIGEAFVIMLDDLIQFNKASLPGGVAVGDPLWIDPADNSLKAAAATGRVKFGVVDALDFPDTGRCQVNTSLRDTF